MQRLGRATDGKSMREVESVLMDLCHCLLQRPSHVMNICPQDPTIRRLSVKAVSLREKVFQRSGRGQVYVRRRSVRCTEVDRCRGVASGAGVLDGGGTLLYVDFGMKIGQMKHPPRSPHRDAVGCVQTQKPDPGFTITLNIESEIQLRKCREAGDVRKRPSHDPRHSEWNDADPRAPVKFLNCEGRRDERAKTLCLDTPVREKKIAP
jgi:hypothetical protein